MTPTQRRLLIAFYVLLYLCCVAAVSFVVFKVVSEEKNHAPTYFTCDSDSKSCTETNTPTKYTSFDACCKACECNNPDPSGSTYYACGATKDAACIIDNKNGTFSNPNTCASTCKTYLRYGDKISLKYNDGYLDMFRKAGSIPALPGLAYYTQNPMSYFQLEHKTKKDGEVVLVGDTVQLTYYSIDKNFPGTLFVTAFVNDSIENCGNKICGFGLYNGANEGSDFVLSTTDSADNGTPVVINQSYAILCTNGNSLCNDQALSINKKISFLTQTCTCDQSPCVNNFLKWTIQDFLPPS